MNSTGDTEMLDTATPANGDFQSAADENTAPAGKLSEVREKLRHILHAHKTEIAVIVLIVLDALIVIFELLIDLKVFGGHLEKTVLPEVLHYLSIIILSFFVVEVSLKIFAFGGEFFKSPMNVVDGIIVLVSFVVDIVFLHNKHFHEAFGLMILLRLWRIVRIVNGIVMSVRTEMGTKLEKKQEEIETLNKRIRELETKIAELQGSDNGAKDGNQSHNMSKPVADKDEIVVDIS